MQRFSSNVVGSAANTKAEQMQDHRDRHNVQEAVRVRQNLQVYGYDARPSNNPLNYNFLRTATHADLMRCENEMYMELLVANHPLQARIEELQLAQMHPKRTEGRRRSAVSGAGTFDLSGLQTLPPAATSHCTAAIPPAPIADSTQTANLAQTDRQVDSQPDVDKQVTLVSDDRGSANCISLYSRHVTGFFTA
ncbi:hypothetical protein CPC08DRAFT_729252 [Agrocybe pediades]|nr:hypothetical protein CPC08DRAFT_729252 [Agrocybe pediades]